MTIRSISIDDADAVSNLSDQLGYPMPVEVVRSRIQLIAANLDHSALVAEIDGQVAGWLHMHIAHILESPVSHVEIVGLIVDEKFRGQGIGWALVAAAEKWTFNQGLHDLKVRSASRRIEAHQFYQSLGFSLVKTQMRFEKKLADQRTS